MFSNGRMQPIFCKVTKNYGHAWLIGGKCVILHLFCGQRYEERGLFHAAPHPFLPIHTPRYEQILRQDERSQMGHHRMRRGNGEEVRPRLQRGGRFSCRGRLQPQRDQSAIVCGATPCPQVVHRPTGADPRPRHQCHLCRHPSCRPHHVCHHVHACRQTVLRREAPRRKL